MTHEQRPTDVDIWESPTEKPASHPSICPMVELITQQVLHIHIHSFNKYVWSDHCVLSTKDSIVNKTGRNPYLHRAAIVVGENRQ